MPELPTAVTKPTATTFVFNYELCKAKLKACGENLEQYNGKPNHNPHLYYRDTLLPLINRLEGLVRDESGIKFKTKETTKELFDAINLLDVKHIPILDPNWKPESEQVISNPQAIPLGLKLPSNNR